MIFTIPLFLLGCATPNVEVVDSKYPANLLVSCQELPQLKGNSLGDLYKYTTNLITLYNECAIRHDSLVKAVEK
mgnify:FL=1